MVYILPLEWPCNIPEVYKVPRLWRRVYYSEKNDVPAVTRKSAGLFNFLKEYLLYRYYNKWSFILTHLILMHPRMLCIKFCWNDTEVLWILSAIFLYFSITGIFSWKGVWSFFFTILIPFLKDALCQVRIKLTNGFGDVNNVFL